MTQLIIAEKPAASSKLAYALGDFKRIKLGRTYYFEGQIDRTQAAIVPAVGHLFSLASKDSKYPNFDLEWQPVWRKKEASFAKPYARTISKLASKADDFIIATDYDVEGEVIGLNCLRFLCNKTDAKRMKFSTLTAPDLKKSYANISEHIDFKLADSGLARHFMDYYFGVNLSKAATNSVYEVTHRYGTLSIGRVQGPTLAILVNKEKEISTFKSKPFWQILAHLDLHGKPFTAIHKTDRFWEEPKEIFEKVKDKPAKLVKLDKSEQVWYPPFPFDLTTLQTEAWRCFKISPKQTLAIAQNLYTAALISYPRTSSQKLPPTIGYKRILQKLASQLAYKDLVNSVLSKPKIWPRQGKKDDPAHPAIFPTGESAKQLSQQEQAIYDLIVKRFIACFGDPAKREVTNCEFDIEEELFVLSAIRTLVAGWMNLYAPYSRQKEIELPRLKVEEVFDQETELKKDKTKPPKRYTPASIIKEMEARGLGTKATRSNILDILYRRGYIQDISIQVTSLGLKIVDTFSKYAPEIVSEELTRKFEEEMNAIREGKQEKERVLSEAREVVTKICSEFDQRKKEIGTELGSAVIETKRAQKTLMTCLKCGKGDMVIRISKKSGKRFLACNQFPKCENTWSLPQAGLLKILNIKCKCGTPMINRIIKGKKPWRFCPNPDCPEKKVL